VGELLFGKRALHRRRHRALGHCCAGSVIRPSCCSYLHRDPGHAEPILQSRRSTPLPAVANLQDHLAVNYVYRSRVPTSNNELYPWGASCARAPLSVDPRRPAVMSVNQAGGFSEALPIDSPDFQLIFNPASYMTTRTRHRRLLNPRCFSGIHMSFQTCRPYSRGHLAIPLG